MRCSRNPHTERFQVFKVWNRLILRNPFKSVHQSFKVEIILTSYDWLTLKPKQTSEFLVLTDVSVRTIPSIPGILRL